MEPDSLGEVYSLSDIARVAGLARAIRATTEEQTSPAREPSRPAFARFATIAVSRMLTIGAVAGLALAAGGGPRHAASLSRQPDWLERPGDAPLALVALEHDRDDGRLIVRGIVRNAPSNAVLRHLTAVVRTVGTDGSVIATRQAAVAAPSLAPGAETAFVVALPDTGAADRYRVRDRKSVV